jgi:uncharacterized protein DUF6491
MTKPVRLIAFASFILLAACAATPAGPYAKFADARGRQCFRATDVDSYSPGPDGFVNVHTAQGPFRLRMTGVGCPDFGWIMQIGIRPMESSWLCEGRYDMLIAPNPAGNARCLVSNIQSLASGPLPA